MKLFKMLVGLSVVAAVVGIHTDARSQSFETEAPAGAGRVGLGAYDESVYFDNVQVRAPGETGEDAGDVADVGVGTDTSTGS
ncbi:MAG: hypothetical protein ABEN55_03390, partial [Bradymonadaceae bacterium]